jgi:GGDEF domain-containing protein
MSCCFPLEKQGTMLMVSRPWGGVADNRLRTRCCHVSSPPPAKKEYPVIMPSAASLPSDGMFELIKKPFEKNDPKSYALIQKLFDHAGGESTAPFSFLIKSLSGITISAREAQPHWKKILEHKRRLELKLCRSVNIKTAAIDFYDQTGIAVDSSGANNATVMAQERQAPASSLRLPQGRQTVAPAPVVPAPGYRQQRLKEEMLRAGRYKHALSAMMIRVDLSVLDGAVPDKAARDNVLGIIDAMIMKAVRNVDICARHSDMQFMVILPNTNKREAQELASRLLKNISLRLHRLPGMPAVIPLAVAVGQCSPKNDTSVAFIKRLENLVLSENGKESDTVLLLE